MAKNRELLAQLEAKEKALAAEQARFNKTKSDLADNSKRLSELEAMLSNKDASMKKLKETLSKALNSFEGKGLTVEQKTEKCMFQWKTSCCSTQEVGQLVLKGEKQWWKLLKCLLITLKFRY